MQPSITAFDTADLVVNELGENMSDMVLKSRQIEDYDKKRVTIYDEFVSQGDVFVQELYTEDFREIPIGELKWNPNEGKISDFSIKKRLQRIFAGPTCRMVNGKKVYMGNIRTQYAEDQEIIAILNIYPRSIAKSMYGTWERWKNVPFQVDTYNTWFNDGVIYKDWNLVALNDYNKVAEIMIYLPQRNLFMILLNGVMMLPIDYPLTAISPTGVSPVSQGKLDPIADFAYSKSNPSNIKIDQEVIDEFLKLAVEKTRQSFKPPMGNKSKKVYSNSIFLAGKITSDIGSGDLFPISDKIGGGVTASEFSFYKMIKENIDEKTTSPQFGGQAPEGAPTAEEVHTVQQQQMMNLGKALDGIINLEKRMTWNRIYNILCHWTKKEDGHVDDVSHGILEGYKTMSVNTTVDNGAAGIRIFRQMAPHKWPHVLDHEHEEDQLSKQYGKPVRISYLDPEALRSIPYRWFIQMNPVPKNQDKLSQVLFMQNISQLMGLFGPQALNMDYVKQRAAVLMKEDYNKLFAKNPDMAAMMNGVQPGMGADGKPAQPLGGGAPAPTPVRPTMAGPSPAMRMGPR